MAEIDFGGVMETVITRKEFNLTKARRVLKKKPLPSSATASRDRPRHSIFATTALMSLSASPKNS